MMVYSLTQRKAWQEDRIVLIFEGKTMAEHIKEALEKSNGDPCYIEEHRIIPNDYKSHLHEIEKLAEAKFCHDSGGDGA